MSQHPKEPGVLTLEEAARYLRLSRERVRRLATEGKIPGRQVGRSWRFLKVVLDHWLRGMESGRDALLKWAGAFEDDETLPDLIAEIYKARGRPEATTNVPG